MKKIQITFTFTNDNNQRKTVKFYIDEQYYKDLHHPSITEEQRNECLLAEYRMYCKDDKYRRKHIGFAVDDESRMVEPADDTQLNPSEQYYEKTLYVERHQILMEYINKIESVKQRQAFIYVYIEGLKQSEACIKMNISKGSFSKLLAKAKSNFEEILGKKYFS